MDTLIRRKRTVAPAIEPITTSQAKKQLEIADSDTTHDDQIELLIQEVREQWEHDTDSATITQTWTQTFEEFKDGMQLAMRPIISISSITYYDGDNTQQTLASSVYSLDDTTRQIRLDVDQTWPTTKSRWDAITVTFTAGYGASASDVPAIAKQAMLYLTGYMFENRDMLVSDAAYTQKPYELLTRRYMRTSYP